MATLPAYLFLLKLQESCLRVQLNTEASTEGLTQTRALFMEVCFIKVGVRGRQIVQDFFFLEENLSL